MGAERGHALDIAIAGGSAAGLFASLLLARAGHQVLVLERDCLQPAPDVESAATAAFRPSAPQIVQPQVFTAVLRTIPTYAAWLEVMDPITGVFPMAGLHNTLRRLVVDGTPVATGLHAIGNSVCTTNPTLGRGLALALSGAADLADAIGEHAADPAAQALALDCLAGDTWCRSTTIRPRSTQRGWP